MCLFENAPNISHTDDNNYNSNDGMNDCMLVYLAVEHDYVFSLITNSAH